MQSNKFIVATGYLIEIFEAISFNRLFEQPCGHPMCSLIHRNWYMELGMGRRDSTIWAFRVRHLPRPSTPRHFWWPAFEHQSIQSRVEKLRSPGKSKLDRLLVKWKNPNYRYIFVFSGLPIFWHVIELVGIILYRYHTVRVRWRPVADEMPKSWNPLNMTHGPWVTVESGRPI